MSRDIPTERIDPDPEQPRKHFDEAAIAGLAASMTEAGLAVPILVRPVGDRFVIVHGERRWRAARSSRMRHSVAVGAARRRKEGPAVGKPFVFVVVALVLGLGAVGLAVAQEGTPGTNLPGTPCPEGTPALGTPAGRPGGPSVGGEAGAEGTPGAAGTPRAGVGCADEPGGAGPPAE